MSPEELLVALYRDRKSRDAAALAVVEAAVKVGDCRNRFDGEACYRRKIELCDACAAKHPLWLAKQAAASKAGATLRKVLAAGKWLSERDERGGIDEEQNVTDCWINVSEI